MSSEKNEKGELRHRKQATPASSAIGTGGNIDITSSSISNSSKNSNSSDGGKKGKNQVLLDWSHTTPSFLSYISLGLGLGWFVTVPLLFCITPIVYDKFPIVIYLVVGCIILSAVYPVDFKYQPNIMYSLGEWMIKTSMRYFSFKVECEDYEALQKIANNKDTPCLFAMEPHGVLPITLFWGKTKAVENLKYRCCLSSSMFAFPMMKHFLTWCGAISVDRKEMIKYMDMGYSLGLCPGGVKEVQFLGDSSECVLYLKEHKGFTKLAMSRGAAVVPTITFGLRNTYSIWKPTQSEWLKTLGSRMGFFPMVFFGLWDIPFAQAKPTPLTLVLGKPVELPKVPYEDMKDGKGLETLNKYHDIVVSEIARVFNENKAANGYSDVTLRIV